MLSLQLPIRQRADAVERLRRQLPQLPKQVLPEVNKRGMAGLGMKEPGGNGQPITKGQ